MMKRICISEFLDLSRGAGANSRWSLVCRKLNRFDDVRWHAEPLGRKGRSPATSSKTGREAGLAAES
ncbi:hypothetical protein [Cupriavidus alkaliphilus]|uniref:hypothetical protein n=1 Tax=Cupriavidus alkaliphilus TaxID=942866 RepID=UPI0016195A5C|nr:hypothetical protein [Cupriavidus alkaliphilus]MBB3016213.1 hypothetical protein [Cupriavidus alkaliphilus]